ncbi:LytTR family DNA-binding domain-containing protein [Undibacterium sp.]|jgi:two-component system LytT family response regulator|uniref:LytR/AlgR family response regulator transcription factor n=1 Tax=Undibacterium sp. TaxID=1914977 RepID=UPI002CFC584A|nr:LytTR family DNA-binding domain-containing protein [Undibacterium sp.]HTD06794.1 LytTR family DNA-binding domain-containing protein [Undibacterium sp.]
MSASTATLTALIVDDEELARRLVREYLGRHADIQIIGECDNGLQAVQDISGLNPDLVFLDIQMPKLTGLEVLELSGRSDGVIFTTAYDQYALKAFDLHAVDYLLKPFSQARFDEALAQARRALGQTLPALANLLAHTAEKLERILIRDRHQVHVIAVEKIDYVEAQDDYISIQSEGKSYLKTQRLSELETQLDPKRFVRVHRSYLINLEKLQGMERTSKDSHTALMRDGKQIPISRAGYERIKAVM